MGATSITGSGGGASKKFTTTELSILANAPHLIFTGIVHGDQSNMSPPANANNVVVFPYALAGGADNYVVILTSISGGAAYVTSKNEDSNSNFISFDFLVENESEVMYMVAKVGSRPNL